MKKSLFILTLILGASGLFAQSVKRVVLLEQFTQASCPPCAPENERIDPIIEENAKAGKLVVVKHQVSWPGYDPMYNHNRDDVNNRVNYYNVHAAPWSVLDGKQMTVADWGQSEIDTFGKVPTPFKIEITQKLSAYGDSIYAHVKITCVQAIAGAMIAHINVVEREINFDVPPGTNGEKNFIFIMKKKLPTAAGTVLANVFSQNDIKEIDVAWALKNVYDINQLAVVAYIQDNANFQVHQAGYSKSNTEIGVVHENPKTSVISSNFTNLVKVYPNPAHSELYLKINSNTVQNSLMQIQISNIQGQVLKEISYTGNNDIIRMDVSTLTPGMYFYTLVSTDSKQMAGGKISIQ